MFFLIIHNTIYYKFVKLSLEKEEKNRKKELKKLFYTRKANECE